ncbi:MAG: hypothetical protein PVG63_09405, partial [Anaerolineales bacterium]
MKKSAVKSKDVAVKKTATSKSEDSQSDTEDHFLVVKFVDKGGYPISDAGYTVKSPDNEQTGGRLTGQVKSTGVKEGDYEVALKTITKAEWSTKEAAVGDKVKLLVETAGIDAGEKLALTIYIRDRNFADHVLETIESEVRNDKVEEEWELQIADAYLEDQDGKEGKAYSYPTFYFTAA